MDDKDNADPEILYHYTDASGLMGIVNKPSFPKGYVYEGAEFDFTGAIKLLASDIRFMNDHAELRFAGKIFAERFDQAAKDWKVPKFRRDLLIQLAHELRGKDFYGEPVQVFAACLSSNGDQLSQWRGYAGGTGGYAIGISKFVLDHYCFVLPLDPSPGSLLLGQLPAQPPLAKVSYDTAEAKASADRLATEIQPARESESDDVDPVFWGRLRAVAEMARFKDKGFCEEQEWRFIHYHAPYKTRMSMPTEFRPGRFGIVPCLPFAINLCSGPWVEKVLEKFWGRPERTIEKLIVGPSSDQTLRVTAARQLLETNGHDPSVVEPSPIPFRG